MTPRITVGLPVYKGADLIPKCLDCLQRQTFRDFEVIISVDGNDLETAAACRPFLMDPRFRMVVHPERLDWVGNFNWLLQQDLQEFFCYRQHDDTTAPEFFEVLLLAAEMEPNAAAVYCDCQYSGGRDDIESAPSIEGESLYRMVRYMEYVPSSAAPLRGLIRRAAIRHAGLVRSDEFRAPLEEFVWLAKLLRWGNFRRVAKPLYYRLDHPRSFTSAWFSSPEDRKRAALTRLFTGLLEVAVPLCRTPEQRRFFSNSSWTELSILFLLVVFQRAQLRRENLCRLSGAPKTRGKYTPAQERRAFSNPPRVKTSTGHQGARAVPNTEIYLSNAPAVPNGKSYLSNVSNAESYLPTPLSTRDVEKQDKQPVASLTGIWGGGAQKRR